MSRAARESSRGADLPPLHAFALTVREADPSPMRGPERDRLAALAESRVRRNEAAMISALDGYLDRLLGVTIARLKGPRARKGTRWWSERVPSEEKQARVGAVSARATTVEVKALDADYILPFKTAHEVVELVQGVGLTVIADSVADVGRRLGRPRLGLGLFDQRMVDTAVQDAVRRMLGVADRHAAEIRAVIVAADSTAADLDEVLDRVREAHRRGGNWVRLAGRTLAIALGNDAALAAARALGVTHVQWLSRRDDAVRPTHVEADGQVRAIGDRFAVGEHLLRFPADPTDLPDSWPEVAGCRCGLMIAPPDEARAEVMRLARKGTAAAARRLVAEAASIAATSDSGQGKSPDGADSFATSFTPVTAPSAPSAPDGSGQDRTADARSESARTFDQVVAGQTGASPATAGVVRQSATGVGRVSDPAGVVDTSSPRRPDSAWTTIGGNPTIPVPTPDEPGQKPDNFGTPVRLFEPIAAYRELSEPLNAVAGQWVGSGGPLVLALAAPIVVSGLLLTVVLAAGTTVMVDATGVALQAGTVLDLVSATSAGVVAQPVP